jgi:hypothetical protein
MPEPSEESKNINESDVAKLRQAVLSAIHQLVDNESGAESKKSPKSPKKITHLKITKPPFIPKIKSWPAAEALKKKFFAPAKPARVKSRRHRKNALIGLLILGIIFITLFQTGLCCFKWQNNSIKELTRVIPFPAAVVNYKFLPYYDWLKEVEALETYYRHLQRISPDLKFPSAGQIQRRIIEKMIDQELLNQLVSRYNIKVSSDEIDRQVIFFATRVGGMDNLREQLKNNYDWTINDFRKYICVPSILKNKVQMKLLEEPESDQAKLLAQDILRRIKENENSFEFYARNFSRDSSAAYGGEMGYFRKEDLSPEIYNAIIKLKPGEISQIILNSIGFHIIEVEEILADDSNEPFVVRFRQILIPGTSLEKVMSDFRSKSRIWQFVRI